MNILANHPVITLLGVVLTLCSVIYPIMRDHIEDRVETQKEREMTNFIHNHTLNIINMEREYKRELEEKDKEISEWKDRYYGLVEGKNNQSLKNVDN